MSAAPTLRRFQHLPIRRKLLAITLLPLLAALPLLGGLLLWWSSVALDQLLVAKVRSDLAVAQGYFERVGGEIGASTSALAQSHRLRRALGPSGDPSGPARPPAMEALRLLLQDHRRASGLDFVRLRQPGGTWQLTQAEGSDDEPDRPTAPDPARSPPLRTGPDGSVTAADAAARPDPSAGLPLGQASAEVAVLSLEDVRRLSPTLAARVQVPIRPTAGAAPTNRTEEQRALVLRAHAPVTDDTGRILAVVEGGVLLNRNLDFIDTLNRVVYPEGALPFGSRGTATLFLEDVRISTNVRLFEGEAADRAIGTRVSSAVREAVLDAGRTWLGSAFVVNDWYLSAYEPLVDVHGERVGMLYVGFLERPFTRLKWGTLLLAAAAMTGVVVVSGVISLRWARRTFAPIERMDAIMAAAEQGHSVRVGTVPNQDELGNLARHLDRLLEAVEDQTRRLQTANAELDAKVAERTAELQTAQQELLRAEKMATVGQLTASVAHEVNNPIAVIQGNLDLLRDTLGPAAAPVAEELRLVDAQIERMRLIVTQLLQFSRPTDYAGYVDDVEPASAFDEALVLVGHRLSRSRVRVMQQAATTRTGAINRQELQQVLVNLLLNAVQAMPDGGVLRLSSHDWTAPDGAPGVRLSVSDDGPGIDPALMADLFRPFVTRRKDGTGLGLWISRGIVERYGGELRAENRPAPEGHGAVFSVCLRCRPQEGMPAIR